MQSTSLIDGLQKENIGKQIIDLMLGLNLADKDIHKTKPFGYYTLACSLSAYLSTKNWSPPKGAEARGLAEIADKFLIETDKNTEACRKMIADIASRVLSDSAARDFSYMFIVTPPAPAKPEYKQLTFL